MPPPYQPVGYCIYCRAASYRPGADEPPHDEHIIPAGIGGTISLPKASCRACEEATNRSESECINKMFPSVLPHLGVRTRGGKSRDKVWTQFAEADGSISRFGVPVGEHPPALITPRFEYPAILSGRVIEGDKIHLRMELARREDYRERREKFGPDRDMVGDVPLAAYQLMLAKIGHAFAIAEVGETFTPILTPWIKGDLPWSNKLGQYVGSEMETAPIVQQLHTLNYGISEGIGGVQFATVRVRLFAASSRTNHIVVVGLLR